MENENGGSEGEAKTSAGKIRSETPYPFFGLQKVTDIVKAVQKAGGNDAAATDVLHEMNVSKTDRLWAYGIPAAILFGLIKRDGRGDDARLNLTALGMRIALPGTPDEERATKAAAFKTPELYGKLLEKFAGHPLPSKDVLRNILQRDFKIVESMAGNAADAFLESLRVAELVTAAGTIVVGDIAPPPDEKPEGAAGALAGTAKPAVETITVPAGFVVYKCKIGGGRVIEIALPHKFTAADVKKLHAFLETQVDDATETSHAGGKESVK